MIKTNQKVITPIGDGVVQGGFEITDSAGNLIVAGVGVRLPVNDVTKSHLKKRYCITPKSELSALFVFPESELK